MALHAAGRVTRILLLAALAIPADAGHALAPDTACARCGWAPPRSAIVQHVSSIADLRRALRDARPSSTILLADGTYALDAPLYITVPGLVLRGASGDPGRVRLLGSGMSSRPGVGISIVAADVVVADLTVASVSQHAIQVHGERGASRVTLHGLILRDAGQQIVKVTRRTEGGLVACSKLGYTDGAPGTYTGGIDILGGTGWTIRDNTFERVRGPASKGWRAGPAILVWAGSAATVVERNRILDSYRGIALGLQPGGNGRQQSLIDHTGGVIRQNVIVNLNAWANEAVEANAAAGVHIDHNSIVTFGALGWSISARFEQTTASVANNLANKPLATRRGASVIERGNLWRAEPAWFVDPSRGDLRLTRGDLAAVDAATEMDGIPLDFDRRPRRTGRAPDVGAFEYGGASRQEEPW